MTRLEKDGILSKVEYSKWATPIVPVVEQNGSLRVCDDFKVSFNPVLLAEQYLLPRIEDIFANLAGGNNLENLKFLSINAHVGLFQYNRLLFGVSSSPAIWQM